MKGNLAKQNSDFKSIVYETMAVENFLKCTVSMSEGLIRSISMNMQVQIKANWPFKIKKIDEDFSWSLI